MHENVFKEAQRGTIDLKNEKANFIMCQEYYDFIEYLQNKFSFDEVYEMQEEFGGSFTRPEEDLNTQKGTKVN